MKSIDLGEVAEETQLTVEAKGYEKDFREIWKTMNAKMGATIFDREYLTDGTVLRNDLVIVRETTNGEKILTHPILTYNGLDTGVYIVIPEEDVKIEA